MHQLVLMSPPLKPKKHQSSVSVSTDSREQESGARGRRKWQFRLLALGLPFVLLLLLEIILRISGYGYSAGFFRKTSTPEGKFLVENDRFARRYFPAALARTPQPLKIPLPKAPGAYRIFVFGESAAMGDPDPSFGFVRVLQVLLEEQYPGQAFEVVNVAVTAINSHVIRKIAEDCVGREGDLWIIYMGNNEVVGPFGAGTVFGAQAPGVAAIRAQNAIKATRVGQLFDSFISRVGGKNPDTWEGMEMFLKQQVRHDDPRLTTVYAHFEKNLGDIIDLGVEAGAKVLISSVVSNLRASPPFASLHKAGLSTEQLGTWERAYQAALTNEAAANWSAAVAKFEEASRVDAAHAELWFRLAQCHWNLGQFEEARAAFIRARDLDTLRFRVDSRLNEIVRDIATRSPREGVKYVDLAQVAAESSPQGAPGAELLYEHVHLNFAGNYLFGRALADEVNGLLPKRIVQSVTNRPPLLSWEDCARRLGYTEFDRQRVWAEMVKRFEQPPFVNQLGHAQRQAERQAKLDGMKGSLPTNALAQATTFYEDALKLRPNDWMLRENYARLLQDASLPIKAEEQWRKVVELMPHYAPPYYSLGNTLDAQNRSAEALIFFRQALRLRPDSLEARNGLGLALDNLGQVDEAKREFQKALQLKPGFAEARINLGQLLARQNKMAEAAQEYRAVLRLNSNSVAAHVNLGKLLSQQGQSDEAIAHYREALRADPKHAVAHYNLGNALAARQNPAALEEYAAAVRFDPKFTEARYNLALLLANGGRNADALEQLREVVRLRPEFAEGHLNLGVALAKAGNRSAAVSHFREALRLDPANPLAQKFLSQAEGRTL